MREKKKSLKLRKFKVANLHVSWLKGGTNSNPCHNTGQTTGSQHSEPTVYTCNSDEYTCPAACGTDPTKTKAMTQPENPCTNGEVVGGITNNCVQYSVQGCLP